MATEREDLKPYVGRELTVAAWLWARAVASSNPMMRGAREELTHLDAMRESLAAVGAKPQVAVLETLYEDQHAENGGTAALKDGASSLRLVAAPERG